MTCASCEAAKVNRWCGMYRADCLECSARALSHSPAHADAERTGKITQRYRDALVVVFGEKWEEGHAMVKRWAQLRSTS